jgi:hypothetical protein
VSISATPPFAPPPCRRHAKPAKSSTAQGPRQDRRRTRRKTQDAPTTHDRHTTSPHLPADRVKMARQSPRTLEPWNPGALGSGLCPPVRVLPRHCAARVPSRHLRPRCPSVQHICCGHSATRPSPSPCLTAPLLRFVLSLVHRLTLLPALLNQRSRSPPAPRSPQAASLKCGVVSGGNPVVCVLGPDHRQSALGDGARPISPTQVPGRPPRRPADRQTTDLPTHDPGDTPATLIRPSAAAAPRLGFRPIW